MQQKCGVIQLRIVIMKKHFIFVFLYSIGFNQTAKSMDFNNCTGSLSAALKCPGFYVHTVLVTMTTVVLYQVQNGLNGDPNIFYQVDLPKRKKTKPFPKKALIKHLKQQNSTKFNSRKNGFYRFGKR